MAQVIFDTHHKNLVDKFMTDPCDPKFVESCTLWTETNLLVCTEWINVWYSESSKPVSWETLTEMMDWCIEHCSGYWSRTTNAYDIENLRFGFQIEEDAMAFKLQWC